MPTSRRRHTKIGEQRTCGMTASFVAPSKLQRPHDRRMMSNTLPSCRVGDQNFCKTIVNVASTPLRTSLVRSGTILVGRGRVAAGTRQHAC